VHAKEVIQETLRRHGKPETVNTDQHSQFTAQGFVDEVINCGAHLSKGGRGAWRGKVFVGRVRRPVKYECVYPTVYQSVSQARSAIARYVGWHNGQHRQRSHGSKTPEPKSGWRAGRPARAHLSPKRLPQMKSLMRAELPTASANAASLGAVRRRGQLGTCSNPPLLTDQSGFDCSG
jgi:hypothetical protein